MIKIYAHMSKYLRISKISASNQNICAHVKISAHIQNICLHLKYLLTSKIFAPHLKYLRISKIYAPHLKYLRLTIYDSNKAAVEISAPYEEYMRPKLLLFGLGRISNFWLLPSLAEELSFRWCCLSSMQSSSEICTQAAQLIWVASLPYCTGCCTGTTCQNIRVLSKYSRPHIFSPFSWEKSKT